MIRQDNDVLIRQPSARQTLAKAFHALASMPDDSLPRAETGFHPRQ